VLPDTTPRVREGFHADGGRGLSDLATLQARLDELLLAFLNGVGLASTEIERLRDLWAGAAL
jgi:hypothetical protein